MGRKASPLDLAYGSHISLLAAAVVRTSGTIVEFGAGAYSTPLLRRTAGLRRVISYEKHAGWARTIGGCVQMNEPWEGEIPEDTDLVFVDCDSPDRRHEGRARVLERLHEMDYQGIVVAHDVKPMFARYYEALQGFASSWVDKKLYPPTGIYTNREEDFSVWHGVAEF